MVGWEGDQFEIEAASLLSQEDGEKMEFVSWSDGPIENVRDFVVLAEPDPDPVVASFENEKSEEAIYDPKELDGGGDEDIALSPVPIADNDDEPKKSTKFVVSLLDMSVSVRFANDIARRRRLAGDSNVDLVALLEDEIKSAASDAVSSAVALAINFPGSTPLHGIRFARKGERAVTDGDGLLYTSTFGGLAIFDREDDLQSIPDAFALQSAQVKALDAVEDELTSDLREFVAEAGGIALGYQHVQSVSAEVIDKVSAGPSNTKTHAGDNEKDPIMTGLLVIAILLILVVAASGLAYFYIRRRSGKEPSKVCRDVVLSRDMEGNTIEEKKSAHQDKNSSGSETDDETPANSPMKAPYDPADPYGYSSGARNLYGDDDDGNDGEASVSSSAANSVASSIQHIARDMISQLKSVLGGPDDDAIQNGEEETNADATLAPVVDRKLD